MHFLFLKRKVDTIESSICPDCDYCSSVKMKSENNWHQQVLSRTSWNTHVLKSEQIPSEQWINTLAAFACIFVEWLRLFGL